MSQIVPGDKVEITDHVNPNLVGRVGLVVEDPDTEADEIAVKIDGKIYRVQVNDVDVL